MYHSFQNVKMGELRMSMNELLPYNDQLNYI
jgi:hypothetical protein